MYQKFFDTVWKIYETLVEAMNYVYDKTTMLITNYVINPIFTLILDPLWAFMEAFAKFTYSVYESSYNCVVASAEAVYNVVYAAAENALNAVYVSAEAIYNAVYSAAENASNAVYVAGEDIFNGVSRVFDNLWYTFFPNETEDTQ